MKNIEKAIKKLLETNPFYAHFFLNSRILYDKHNIPTAAVMVTARGPTFIFNTEFMSKLTPDEVCAVVEHETMHVVFEHCTDFGKQKEKKLSNIAMDCAINQYIRWPMPKDSISLDVVRGWVGDPSVEAFQTWEYYYAKLLTKAEELRSADGGFDEHMEVEVGADGELTDPKTGKSINASDAQKAAIRKAIDGALKSSAGNAPEHILKAFGSMSGAEAKLPWKQLLANWVASRIDVEKRATRKKANRRFDLDQPGKTRKRTALRLGVCVDSSGSVSDEAFKAFMTEICRISSMCAETYVIDADCEVQSIQAVKKTNYKTKLRAERHGGGGTAYAPAIEACVKLKCDAIIYFGDMDAADEPKDPRVPFLWVIVGSGKPPGSFGRSVVL